MQKVQLRYSQGKEAFTPLRMAGILFTKKKKKNWPGLFGQFLLSLESGSPLNKTRLP